MLHQSATAVNNLPWWRRRTWRRRRAAGSQGWVSDRSIKLTFTCSGGCAQAIWSQDHILQAQVKAPACQG